MKIAINCAFYQPKGGGIKEYIFNLIENLNGVIPNDWVVVIYVLQDYYEYAINTLNTKFKIKKIPFKGKGLMNTIIRSTFEDFFWRKEEKKEAWDIFHSPFFHAPKLSRTKLILTVHDMRFYRYPETYTFLRYIFLRSAVKSSVKRADKIISISQFTKNELISAYAIPQEKLCVIHEAINPSHFSINGNLTTDEEKLIDIIKKSKFILTVGHLEPRKNYKRLIQAVSLLNENLSEKIKLVIVGKLGHDYQETLELIDKTDEVVYFNFVSQNLLNWLYAHATLFVFPSIYEGFGFPPLEAAIHGTISAVSQSSSIPEICGSAAIYFDAFSEVDISNKIREGIFNKQLRLSIRKELPNQLKKFSWMKNAAETMQLYELVYNKTESK